MAGQTTTIVDIVTGEIINAYIFVEALFNSQYAYVEAFLSQNYDAELLRRQYVQVLWRRYSNFRAR